ncbi:aspartate aminotransferase family protein [Caldalkalibacillus thermarum TA2.A1]|uniref:glutamate-1-semialdehyde 2,1-aminomutase n=1 Tax=Caldalkalibacillus thermarum (strain TA2.A1) TaxID=986075 RepID=A0A8X8I2G0_CALTT|nr:aspartate aminotransferase family protein [Caldalkalibacillus thermarum]QZT33090.1 aspartate aminotransferase family protein [Caldalkalibacillus thermarum TA2.A1]
MAIVTHQDPLQLLKSRTQKSFELFKEAQKVMPGGVTANIKYFEPYPIIMEAAEGARLKDVDGNEYVDYLLAYGALILGHGHHKVMNAVIRQMVTKGTTIYGTPHELEMEMAKRLIKLYPGIEQVRYTNSGTEATLLAIRVAHAYTGKPKIAKFEGHYHGGYDQVLLSINPPLEQAGPADRPVAVPDSAGVDPYYLEHTVILPFNDLEACAAILKEQADQLAAVVVEPVQAGFIPATETFMRGLRKLTEELGILLIFDEVKTCFRVALGGAQSVYGVTPDLTALGKVLGGGFPIGAVGGKKEIMEVASPHGKKDVFEMNVTSKKKDVLFHSGTYNGHPSVLAAGLATLDVLEDQDNFETIVRTTEKLRRGLENVLKYYQIPAQTLGMGSIFNVVMTAEKITNYRDLQNANLSLRRELDYHLLTLGIYTKPLNRYSLSLAHGDREIQQTIDAYEAAVKRLLVARGSLVQD